MYQDIVGANIRKHRVAQKWTQEKLGDFLSVSHQIISKWENGIASPDLNALCAIANLFGISLDTLCGLCDGDEELLKAAKEIAEFDNSVPFSGLECRFEKLKTFIARYPTNDALFLYALQFARQIHDHCDNDAQIVYINAEIEALAQRVLDFSNNDAYRSTANYNLALCYMERVNRGRASEEDRKYAQKAMEYAQRVLYKDMDPMAYALFGSVTAEEDLASHEAALLSALALVQRSVRDLQRRCSFMDGTDTKQEAVTAFSKQLARECESLREVLA